MKKICMLVILLLAAFSLLPVVGFAQSKQDAIRLHKEANAAQEKAQSHADLKQAEQKYLQAIAIYQQVGEKSNLAYACYSVGLIYAGLGRYDKAVEYYEKSLAICRELRDRKGEASNLKNLGLVYKDWGQYDKAVEYYEKSLAICRELKDLTGQGYILEHLGDSYEGCHHYTDAVKCYEKSLAIRRQLKDRSAEASILRQLNRVYVSSGQEDKALECLEKALRIQRELKETNGVAWSSLELAFLLGRRGKREKQRHCLEDALRFVRECRDRNSEALVENVLGIMYEDVRQYQKSEEHFLKSLAIYEGLGQHTDVVGKLSNLAGLYMDWGKYDKAGECRRRIVAEERHHLGGKGVTESLVELAEALQNIGQFDEALTYYELEAVKRREKGDGTGEANVTWKLADLHCDLGRYSKATDYYLRVLDIARGIKDRAVEALVLERLGKVCLHSGRFDESIAFYEKSLALRRQLMDRSYESRLLMAIGQVFRQKGQFQDALAYFEKAKASVERSGGRFYEEQEIADLYMDQRDLISAESLLSKWDSRDSPQWGRIHLLKSEYEKAKGIYEKIERREELTHHRTPFLFTAYTGLGRVYEGLEDYPRAAEYYEKGMKMVEEIRSSLTPAQRKNFFEVKINGFSRAEPAQGLTRVRMKMNRGTTSIESSEVIRARSFSDGIAQRTATGVAGVPEDVLKQEEQLWLQVAALKNNRNKIEKDKQPDVYENIQKQVVKVEKALNEFVDMLRKKYPGYAAVKYPQPVPLKDSALKTEERAVMFDVSSEGVGVKLLKGKKISQTFYTEWKYEDLERDIRKFRQSFEQLKLKEFDPELGLSLYRKLLLPILAQVPEGAPLIIMPDGVLWTLPFEALVVSGKPTWKELKGKPCPEGLTYLGDLYPVSYYQSITALTLARTLKPNEKPGAKTLVIADPVFESDDSRVKSAFREEKRKILASLPETLMAIKKQTGLTFPRLSQTADLAESLKKLNPGGTVLFTGPDAKKSILFEKPLTDYGCIVFATHGYFGKDIPGIQEPVLAMTLVDQPKGQDGFLRMTEVMGMKLKADVVALTACQTGLGSNVSGEGVMSMGRAFQYAGAKSVLMSLWSVSEAGSVKLVESFFRNLKEGKNKLEALKLAREEVRKDGYDHPFYWAPFILVGEVN